MNVPTIEMEPEKARELWLEYRAAVKETNREADRDLVAGYRALAQGKKIIDVNQTMLQAGLNDRFEPRLAIGRADAQHVYVRVVGQQVVFHMEQSMDTNRSRRCVKFPRTTFPPELSRAFGQRWQLRAVVPSIPPRFRPKTAYENYHILWEAEWERVPTDPILLRHLSGSLYVVLACWDLTELEKAILQRAL